MAPTAPIASSVLPRYITRVDLAGKQIFCTRSEPCADNYAISHRWESRDEGCLAFAVECDDEPLYTCLLTEREASNVSGLLARLEGGMFLDYACIIQDSDQDKCAQVSIMGSIYLGSVSVPLGEGLSTTVPPAVYCHRAWCFQERFFGKIIFLFDASEHTSDDEAFDRLVVFAQDIVFRTTGIQSMTGFIRSPMPHTEDWRYKAIRNAINAYPLQSTKNELTRILELLPRPRSTDVVLELIKLSLSVRQADNPIEVNARDLALFMIGSQATVAKDRLYGVWGVPAQLKGIQLDYGRPDLAWDMVAGEFPLANFAFYGDSSNRSFRHVRDVVCDLLEYPVIQEQRCPLSLRTLTCRGVSLVAAWDAQCLGLAFDSDGSNTSFHFVISVEALRELKGKKGNNPMWNKLRGTLEAAGASFQVLPDGWKIPLEIGAMLCHAAIP